MKSLLTTAIPYFLFVLFLGSCQVEDEQVLYVPDGLMQIPDHFPPVEFPEDNAFTIERWELGKQLFFDPILSVDTSISCASCHQPALAFSDGLPVSLGAGNVTGRRNSPSLGNIAYHPYFTREGGLPTLEMQVLVPIQEHDEFNFNIVLIAERLQNDPAYIEAANKAYGRDPDPFVITRSLATFERSLITGNSIYDQYLKSHDPELMSPSQLRGMELFFSDRTNCGSCHSGFNFTNYAFENNGLYEEYKDPGRERFSNDPADNARFKVPSLRNIEMTAPYMHDGSISSLKEVVAHYNSGGRNHPNKSPFIKPLGLSDQEINDLVAFLGSLTDQSFIRNPNFSK